MRYESTDIRTLRRKCALWIYLVCIKVSGNMHEIITSFYMKVVLHEVRTLCHRFEGGFSIIITTLILMLEW
jgi:hypothetical protein